MADSRPGGSDNGMRIVLIGKTGSGKSALGNLLLDKNAFESKMTAVSVTSHCEKSTARLPTGETIMVVDTPGLYDTNRTIFQTMREVVRCMDFTKPGPHLFILVIRIGRTTEEELSTIRICKKRLGSQVMKHVLIAFTCKDNLDEGSDIRTFALSAQGEMKSVIEECFHRYIGVNNRTKGSDRVAERENALAKIKTIIGDNARFYEFKLFKEADDKVQEVIKKMKKEKKTLSKKLTEAKKKMDADKKADFENKMMEIDDIDEEDEERIEMLIKDLEKEIEEFSKTKGGGSCCIIQ